jgi:hypothetical protein
VIDSIQTGLSISDAARRVLLGTGTNKKAPLGARPSGARVGDARGIRLSGGTENQTGRGPRDGGDGRGCKRA